MTPEIIISRDPELQIDYPYLMVPQRIVAVQSNVEDIMSYAAYPPRDVLPEEAIEPYISVPLDKVKELHPNRTKEILSIPKLEFSRVVFEEAEMPIQSGFVIASDLDASLLLSEARGTLRTAQRLFQYEMLTATYDKYKVKGENEVKFFLRRDNKGYISMPLETLRRILESWYDGELFYEPLSREVARGRNESRLPKPEDVLSTVMTLIRRSQNNNDLFEDIEHFANRNWKDPEIMHVDTESKTQKESNQEEADEKAKKQDIAYKVVQEGRKNLKQGIRTVESEVLYVHDPVLDEPSDGAAAYVRDLLRRPF